MRYSQRAVIPLHDRLLLRTERAETGCLLWTGALKETGYGTVNRGRTGEGLVPVHRAMWEHHNGPIPAGLDVCHKCDVRHCCEITHLFLGTRADNMADAVAKGRQAKGERFPQAKLTEAAVREIRRCRTLGVSARALAIRFAISESRISDVASRKAWRHVRDEAAA